MVAGEWGGRRGTKQLGLFFYSIPDLFEWKFSSAAHSVGELNPMESLCLANVKLLPCYKKICFGFFSSARCAYRRKFRQHCQALSHTAVLKAATVCLKKGLEKFLPTRLELQKPHPGPGGSTAPPSHGWAEWEDERFLLSSGCLTTSEFAVLERGNFRNKGQNQIPS